MSDREVIQRKLAELTQKLKRKAFVESLMLTSVIWVIICYLVLYWFSFSWLSISALIITYFVVALFIGKSQLCSKVNQTNVLEHLNRVYPQLEESAQLLVVTSENLPLLLRLQQKKITTQFILILADKVKQQLIFGDYRYKGQLTLALALIAMSVFFQPLTHLEHYINQRGEPTSTEINEMHSLNRLVSAKVVIEPPSYTGLLNKQSDNLNIQGIIGSKIMWQLAFTQNNLSYALVFSNGQELALTVDNGYLVGELIMTSTGLYQIKAGAELLPQIYTLEMKSDLQPSVRILTPQLTITEILTQAKPLIETQVQVSDDFGLSKVDILASIAKGSGEAVKFRDQVFEFDDVSAKSLVKNSTGHNIVNEYVKVWDLTELDMEPGDELYFSVRAWDNKSPEPQLTQSITKIVRWLEDSDQAVMADGVLIDFMPEYFKSQRQIIIETEQLIADSSLLSTVEFSQTSELLGVAQSELKQKYGQYLGDEFEDSTSEQPSSLIQHSDDHDEEGESDKSHQDKEAHEEQHQHNKNSQSRANEGVDTAYEKVLAQHAHTHEDSDVGLMGKQDPVALMKRSVANMWEAELYLMLSKPEQALPYEQEALKFLKMAQKAERIYVKRLGFEPPPVNEDRRYQGDLEEIESVLQAQHIKVPTSEYQTLSDVYTLLSHPKLAIEQLTAQQRELFSQVKALFNQQVSTRPALIEFVATIEKILLGNRIYLTDCQACIVKLRDKIWQLMPSPKAVISTVNQTLTVGDALAADYINNIQPSLENTHPSTNKAINSTEEEPL
ncbi:hypothetical protein [Thalassotalea piscium]|uniref:DUF4175 domain-containing protein n=1 Tax=Thalassotalea piscium TaxID=1230533 RepID=A0A7X0NGT5_9GAMM|nr:hypothetical protein [Thalassotalea piscium]MBB6543189.1 hypothetical protein [Thalassotalea piscium]